MPDRGNMARAAAATAKWAKKSEGDPRMSAILSIARSEPGIPVLPDALDRDPMLLNCKNGTLDLRTGELRPHRREDLITKCVSVEYDPTAECRVWLAFLDKIMGGKSDMVAFLQRAVGYSLTGSIREQCLFLLHGTGSNGKSTYLEVLRELLADYCEQTDFATFLEKKNDQIRNDVARLRGARFVSAVEVAEARRLDEALIKSVTGGDTVTARFLYGEFFEFVPAFKLWLAANHKPVIRGTDHAIWRRVRLVPFTVTIPDEEQDKDLPAKLKAELPGILRWAVEGCLAWQRDGLRPPEEVIKATASYREENDIVGQFVTENCIVSSGSKATAKALYAAYVAWADANGERPMTQNAFGRRLAERGFERKKSGGIWWHGIELLEASAPTDHGSREPDPF